MVQHDRSEKFFTTSCISYATSCRIGYIPIMRDRRIKLFHGEEIDGKEVRVYIEICKSAAKLVIFLLISKYKDMIFKNKCINYNNNFKKND